MSRNLRRFWGLLPALLAFLLPAHLTAATPDTRTDEFTVYPPAMKGGGAVQLVMTLNNCPTDTNLSSQKPDVVSSGSGLTIEGTPAVGKCSLQIPVRLAEGTRPGDYKIAVKGAKGDLIGVGTFLVEDITRGPIPPSLSPEVDLSWNVMSYDVCSDDFGKRVAGRFYCIELLIGNNTGYALQLAGVAFQPASVGNEPTRPVSTNSYVVTRSVLQKDQMFGARNIAYRSLQSAGLLATSLIPFFRATTPRANYTAVAAIIGNVIPQGFDSILPDRTVRQLANLDDQTLRDGVLVPNNTQIRTIVFVDQATIQSHVISFVRSQKEEGLLLRQERTGKNLRQEEAKPCVCTSACRSACTSACPCGRAPQLTEEDKTAYLKAITRKKRFTGKSNALKNHLDPALVAGALHRLVLIGDKVAYINRMRVDAEAPVGTVAPPPTVTGPLTVNPDPEPGKEVTITIQGRHLEHASVTVATQGVDNPPTIKAPDPNGNYVTVLLNIPKDFKGNTITLTISTKAGSTMAAFAVKQKN